MKAFKKLIYVVLYSAICANCYSQTITSIAGIGMGELPIPGDTLLVDSIIPDGEPAIQNKLYYPYGLALDNNGNVFVGENFSSLLRAIGSNGLINTKAGNRIRGYSNDGQSALNASMDFPAAVAVDASGNIFIADWGNHCIRKIDTKGIITTIAGNGNPGYSGDGGPATSAQLNTPSGIVLDKNGNIYFTEFNNHVVRKIDASGMISTVAGNGSPGCSPDQSGLGNCKLNSPHGLAFDANGNIYVVDAGNHKIRKIALASGSISTIAGNGTPGYSGDNGSATNAQLNWPHGVALDNTGNVYVTDHVNHRIRKISGGIITTYAGVGSRGFSGDNGPANKAEIGGPIGIVVDSAGAVYFTDTFNHRIRVIK